MFRSRLYEAVSSRPLLRRPPDHFSVFVYCHFPRWRAFSGVVSGFETKYKKKKKQIKILIFCSVVVGVVSVLLFV